MMTITETKARLEQCTRAFAFRKKHLEIRTGPGKNKNEINVI